MNDRKEALKLQIRFSNSNLKMAGFLIVFYAVLLILGAGLDRQTYIYGTIVAVALMLDFFAGKCKYFNSLLFAKIMRQIIGLTVALAMMNGNNYRRLAPEVSQKEFYCIFMLFIILSLTYFAMCVEHMFMFDVTEFYYQINAVAQMVVPLAIITFLEYILCDSVSSADILLVLGFISCLVGLLFCILMRISEIMRTFFDKLFKQERLAINSKEESDNLKLYQSKLVRANEQLSKQKVQLEIANATITRSNTEMKMQHMLVKRINSELDYYKIIEFITQGMIEHLNLDLSAVIIRKIDGIDETEEVLCSVNATKDSALGDDIQQTIRGSEFVKLYGLLPNATYVVDNKVPDSKYDFLIGSNIGSLLIYPMAVQENTTGVLIAGKNSYGYFKDNIPFYETIVEQIILALRNAFMYSKVQDMATKDALTTIYNRRYFNSVFPQFIDKALKEQKSMTVILFDIDRFKVINDNYGHIFGDQVIKYCGKIAGEYAKKYDGFAVRYGGEEFVITFIDKKAHDVYPIIKELHETIKNHEFDCEGKNVQIDVSIGITSYPDICTNINDLLNYADLTMYESKKNGRGRITIDSSERS